MTPLTRRQSIAMAAVGSAILANPTKAFSQSKTVSALNQIRALDYTIIYTRDMTAMRKSTKKSCSLSFARLQEMDGSSSRLAAISLF